MGIFAYKAHKSAIFGLCTVEKSESIILEQKNRTYLARPFSGHRGTVGNICKRVRVRYTSTEERLAYCSSITTVPYCLYCAHRETSDLAMSRDVPEAFTEDIRREFAEIRL